VTITSNGNSIETDHVLLSITAIELVLHAPMDGTPDDIVLPASPWVANPSGTPVFVSGDPNAHLGQALQVNEALSQPGIDYSDVELNTGQFAVSFWVTQDVGPAWSDLVSSSDSEKTIVLCTTDTPGQVYFGIEFAGGHRSQYPGPTVLDDPNFTHVVATYDGVDMKLYKNAVEVGGVSGINEPLPICSTINVGGIADTVNNHNFYLGNFDEVKVYNFGLNAAQVEYLYLGCTPEVIAVDITGDCKVDLDDLALGASEWLEDGTTTPTFP